MLRFPRRSPRVHLRREIPSSWAIAAGRAWMVAGDHDHPHPCSCAVADRRRSLRSRGIDHADNTEPHEFFLRRKDASAVAKSPGNSRYAIPSVRSASSASASIECWISHAPRVGQRSFRLTNLLCAAACQQHVGRTFDEQRCDGYPLRSRACVPCSSACALTKKGFHLPARSGRACCSGERPAFRAATLSAPSVGSPITTGKPSRSTSSELFETKPALNVRFHFTRMRCVHSRVARTQCTAPRGS